MLAVALPTACDDSGEPVGSGGEGSTGSASEGTATQADASGGDTNPSGTSGASADTTDPTGDPSGPTSDPATTDTPTTGDDSSGDEGPIVGDGWIEIGYGLDEFFPFEGELPVTLGPQGFMMFSLPLRGSDFPVPADPYDFEDPDTPVLSVWTDIDGIPGEHPSGHFAAYLNYPVPFSFSDDEGVDYEFVSVWLVIPETYSPQALAGHEAVVHAELRCGDGQLLVDEHTLTVVDGTKGTGTKGDG